MDRSINITALLLTFYFVGIVLITLHDFAQYYDYTGNNGFAKGGFKYTIRKVWFWPIILACIILKSIYKFYYWFKKVLKRIWVIR